MSKTSKGLFYFYIAAGVLALLFTWVHIPAYLGNGLIGANVSFWNDALFNGTPAGHFLAVDILYYALAGSVFIVVESRRLGIKYPWLYVFIGILVAISFAFPLFLAWRERHLARRKQLSPTNQLTDAPATDLPLTLKLYDIIGLGLYAVGVAAAGLLAL